MYEESIRYYVRALAMNPKADNAWQYLRISLRYHPEVENSSSNHANLFHLHISNFRFHSCSCVSRNDMVEACDSRNLELLQKEFPL